MCEDCGCSAGAVNSTGHTHTHTHTHTSPDTRVDIGVNVLAKNDNLAAGNREFFKSKKLFAVNIISSPGSGKTSILERMAAYFGSRMAVVVGDEQTTRDAERVIRAGSSAYQIQTGGGCHLDAHGVAHALEHLQLAGVEFLIIENVGNLVCPAAFDLGEHVKAAILSTPEGDDKVLKYPSIFSRVNTLIINKIDLLDYVSFDVEKAVNECKSLNRGFNVYKTSAKTGEGLLEFYESLEKQRAAVYN